MEFYGDSIVLEYETDLSYLGVQIVCRNGTYELKYMVPGYQDIAAQKRGEKAVQLANEQWRYRSPAAGASQTHTITGLVSRLHLAARMAHPVKNARLAIVQLLAVYVQTDHARSRIWTAIKKQRRRYSKVYSLQFSWFLQHVLGLERCECVWELRKYFGKLSV